MDNRPKRTQAELMLEALERNPAGLCASTILHDFDRLGITHRYPVAVQTLRKAGHQITTRRCSRSWHSHDSNRIVEYVLEEHTTLF